jgi:hypothetical protein
MITKAGIKAKELAPPRKESEILGWAWELIKPGPKIVHYMWGNYRPLVYIIPRLLGKKVIVHWIGTDVMYATSTKEWILNSYLRKIAYKIVDLHLVDFDPLAIELGSIGIDAEVIPLMPDVPLLEYDLVWPRENSVFVYLPEKEQEFYGSEIVFKVAKNLPDIEFLITGHSGKHAPRLPNIEYLGYVDDLESVWRRVKIYLRLTKHDGLSHSVIEALARGKHVIWSYEFPYCHKASTFQETIDALRNIFMENQPNVEAARYVRYTFDPVKIVDNLKQHYLKILKY